jgi:hypothetical protein
MDEKQAEALAKVLQGEAWDTGGGMWVVQIVRGDGKLVVFSGDCICEYEDDDAFDQGKATNTIHLATGDEPRWVVEDQDGAVFYPNAEFDIGWRLYEDAAREAQALASRTGDKYKVREQ